MLSLQEKKCRCIITLIDHKFKLFFTFECSSERKVTILAMRFVILFRFVDTAKLEDVFSL